MDMAEEAPAPAESGTLIRFGILGCARIASKLSRAISLAPNATVHAVASRSIDKARKFAADNGLPPSVKTYGSYEAVLDDPEVDAVYLPLPTTLHVRWAVAAAEKKKHVLLEKPAAVNAAELDRILEACEANKVQFMDATMWVHHPRTAKMKEFISDAVRFGELKLITTTLSYNPGPEFLNNDIRVNPDLDSLGVLGDLGWYCVRAILWPADYNLPNSVVAMHGATRNAAGVLLSCGATLHWDDGKIASFHCSFLSYLSFDLTAIGTKGSVRLHDYLLPFREKEASFFAWSEKNEIMAESGWAPATEERCVAAEVPQEVVMVGEFARLVEGIRVCGSEPEKCWGELSKKTQMVLDAVMASMEKSFQPVEIN